MAEGAWTKEMMDAEVIVCAHYGDCEDLRALLTDGADSNAFDDGKSTGMHKAAANGEVAAMKILKEFGAKHLANEGGNLPIHWAAQNGQLKAFQFLIEAYECDVLQKNGQGRSTLTEAFSNGDKDVLEAVLSHPSASEENLIATQEKGGTVTLPKEDEEDVAASFPEGEEPKEGNTVFSNTENAAAAAAATVAVAAANAAADYDESNAVTHSLALSDTDNRHVMLRELPITRADNPFGSDTAPEDDTTGLGLWPATLLCARWMTQEHIVNKLQGKVVVELGAGCGLPGIAAAYYGAPSTVYITDIHEPTLRNAVHNIDLNKDFGNVTLGSEGANRGQCCISGVSQPTSVFIRNVSWTEKASFPPEEADVLIGSDLVYDSNILGVLCPAVHAMLKNGGTFLYVAPDDARDGMAALVDAMQAIGLVCVKQEACDDAMYGNPLCAPSKVNYKHDHRESNIMDVQSDNEMDTGDDFVLHFYDLARKQPHTLFEFVKVDPTTTASA